MALSHMRAEDAEAGIMRALIQEASCRTSGTEEAGLRERRSMASAAEKEWMTLSGGSKKGTCSKQHFKSLSGNSGKVGRPNKKHTRITGSRTRKV